MVGQGQGEPGCVRLPGREQLVYHRVCPILMHYRRYVAPGDSCAEGLDDLYPDDTMYRGRTGLNTPAQAFTGWSLATACPPGGWR